MPHISIIIPTYNRAGFIGETINSVLAQTYQDFEIIVADDGSTDNTAEVVAEFGNAVTYVFLPHRGQPAATRNAGLTIAQGEFIAFLDSDDLYLPRKLEIQSTALDTHPNVGIVYSNGYFFKDNPNQPTGYVQDGLPTPSGDIFPELLRGNFLAPPVILIRRLCLDTAGLFDENTALLGCEDYDLWLRIAVQYQALYLPETVAAIRRHSQNISRDAASLRTKTLFALQKIEMLHPELLKKYPIERHEAYARNHGAVAKACFQQKRIYAGFVHGIQALFHALKMPNFGLTAFSAWQKRDRLRKEINR